MTDAVTGPLAGLIGAWLETSRCAAAYRHDVRREVGRAKFPALACYVAEESIYEGRAGYVEHELKIGIDYYLGPVEERSLDDKWEAAREAARRATLAMIKGTHVSWPPAPAVPGTPIRSIIPGLEIIEPQGAIRYGYFHPIAPGAGQSYIGFRGFCLIRYRAADVAPTTQPLEMVWGEVLVPAEGALAEGVMVEFRPL